MLQEREVVVMLSRPAKENGPTIPAKLQPLLNEYANIWPDDLSDQLPPMKDVQHKIDFIPGSSIPHLPHYKMSPKEHDILQQIVNELLANKLIRPSLSP